MNFGGPQSGLHPLEERKILQKSQPLE